MPQTMETRRGLRTIHGSFSDDRIPEHDLNPLLKVCVLAANPQFVSPSRFPAPLARAMPRDGSA